MTKRYSLAVNLENGQEFRVFGNSMSELFTDLKQWLLQGYTVSITDHRLGVEYEYVTKIDRTKPELN